MQTTREHVPPLSGKVIEGWVSERLFSGIEYDEDQMQRQTFGRYIVADPKICHGKLTFRGTRVLVADVLEQVARGMNWDDIMNEWNGNITRDAISEALYLASRAFLEHIQDYAIETYAR